jgi:AraC-like DNA-binding protein
MGYYTIKPQGKLENFIRYFWVFEGIASGKQPYIHRTLANGCPELIFHYQGTFDEITPKENFQPSFKTGIHGQTKHFKRFSAKGQFGIFGVYLYPYAMSALFDIPAIEFTNQLPELSSFLKNADHSINERMLTAPDNKARVSIITKFLESRLKKLKRPELAFAVMQILKAQGQANITELASQCSASARSFERNFKEQIGFSPKSFSRITRFNSVLGTNRNKQVSLTEMAYNFGYYDQSHFIQDFKTFSGYNPNTYFSGKASELL